jgi:ribosomal protein S6E (S10)
MEAATPLRPPRVSIFGDVVVADGLAVRDRCAVELVRERAEAGADPAEVLVDAVEIGARVLSREQAEVNADFVRTEFEKVSREVEGTFTEKARLVAEFLDKRVSEVFAPENGQLAKELERMFGADSAVAVQHQLRAVMSEQSARMREDLLKQFSSADAHNPLADFKAGTIAAMKRAAEQQDANLQALNEQIAGLKGEVVKLQAEREKQLEVAAEHARSTAKGRPYEEAVFEAVDALARARGDDCDAVGDLPGTGGRKGDVLVGVDGAEGPARARIVFEAKNSYAPKNKAVAELDDAMAQRDADYAVWVVPSEDLLPGHGPQLREVNGDKLFVVYDPEDGRGLGIEVAYSLARARTLMAKASADGLDGGALRAEIERALAAMDDVRRIKLQLTGATNGIEAARRVLDDMAERVRNHLIGVDGLVAAATGDDAPPQGRLV